MCKHPHTDDNGMWISAHRRAVAEEPRTRTEDTGEDENEIHLNTLDKGKLNHDLSAEDRKSVVLD